MASLPAWTLKVAGEVAPDERLPWPQTFGAIILYHALGRGTAGRERLSAADSASAS